MSACRSSTRSTSGPTTTLGADLAAAPCTHLPARWTPPVNFDHHPLGSRAFNAAHMFGAIRRVLDIWEGYFEARSDPMSLLEPPANARADPGGQTGAQRVRPGPGYHRDRLCPRCRRQGASRSASISTSRRTRSAIASCSRRSASRSALTAEFRGFAESASDLVALITAHALRYGDRRRAPDISSGNLYVLNELNRFAELSDNDQIRIASNSKRMRDVVDVATPADQLTQPELHELGEPLTGALFDIFVEIYQGSWSSVARSRPISAEEARRAPTLSLDQEKFRRGSTAPSKSTALRSARPARGARRARPAACADLDPSSPDWLTFREVAIAFLTADRSLTGWRHQDDIAESFAWRDIGPPRPPGRVRSLSAQEALRFLLRRRLCARSQVEWRHQRRARLHAAPVAPSRSPGSTEGSATPHEHRETI